MVLRRVLCSMVIFLLISCEDPMLILYPEKNMENSGTNSGTNSSLIKNYTNITNEGKGEHEGNQTIIVNNSGWSIKANIYRADSNKTLLKTVHMNRRGDNSNIYDPSTITITYAPIYVELTDYKNYLKANLNTKNYIYFLDK